MGPHWKVNRTMANPLGKLENFYGSKSNLGKGGTITVYLGKRKMGGRHDCKMRWKCIWLLKYVYSNTYTGYNYIFNSSGTHLCALKWESYWGLVSTIFNSSASGHWPIRQVSGEVPEPGLGDPTQVPGVNPLVADSRESGGRLEGLRAVILIF